MAANWSRQMWDIFNGGGEDSVNRSYAIRSANETCPTTMLTLQRNPSQTPKPKTKKKKRRCSSVWSGRWWWRLLGTTFKKFHARAKSNQFQFLPNEVRNLIATVWSQKNSLQWPTFCFDDVTWLAPSLTWTACASAFHVSKTQNLTPQITNLIGSPVDIHSLALSPEFPYAHHKWSNWLDLFQPLI